MLLIGTGGFASDLLCMLYNENHSDEIVLYDDKNNLEDIAFKDTFKILTNKEEVEKYFRNEDNRFIIGIGDGAVRERMAKEFKSIGGVNPTYISKNAYVSPGTNISDEGVIIMNYASVSAAASIGEGSIVYINSGVGHHSIIGKYCLISASVYMSNVKIGDYSVVGIGSSLKPGITLGSHTVVGTGSVVTRSFGNYSIIFGNPAREKS